ncbi:major facilitator superfamily domain-containing protein [Infundibulicybe gibba]|nr:major facilitator superfamily domain-containing protein [Infundibulicybe gibba]
MAGSLKTRLQSVSLIFACGTALFSDGYANGVIGSVNTLLTRIYGAEALAAHNYSRTLTSLGFAGTVVGMLTFGYLSDKVGRKFGMMAASGIVVVFSALAAASSGAHGSVGGLLSMLSACRFLLGIGVGAEYPCGSVAASEQSEEEKIEKNAQHRWLALATNSMIDMGFVISAFTPLVLFWMQAPPFRKCREFSIELDYLVLVLITLVLFGGFPLRLALFRLEPSSSGGIPWKNHPV